MYTVDKTQLDWYTACYDAVHLSAHDGILPNIAQDADKTQSV